MTLNLPSNDAALQEPKITMESTPETDDLGANVESDKDPDAEKNELAEYEVDEQSKNGDARVQSEDVCRRYE